MSWRLNESAPRNGVNWKVACNHILSNNNLGAWNVCITRVVVMR